MPTSFTHPLLYKLLELPGNWRILSPVPLLITVLTSRNYIVSRNGAAILMSNEMLGGTPQPHDLMYCYIES